MTKHEKDRHAAYLCGGATGEHGCGEWLPATAFQRKGYYADGDIRRHSTCKLCCNARRRYLRNGAEQPLEVREPAENTLTNPYDQLFLED